jgi:transcriptional regulator with XRE-family HTH domain
MLKYNNLYYDFGGIPLVANRLRKLRENQMVSRSELARKARISALTVARIEKGEPCRKDTKRKILAALGLTPLDKDKVFPEN